MLLKSVARADAAEWERENSSERYCNSQYHKDREKQLYAVAMEKARSILPFTTQPKHA